MPRRLPTTCAKLTPERWAEIHREMEAAKSHAATDVEAAEDSDIVEMTSSEFIRQMDETHRAQSEAAADQWRAQAEAEQARIRAEEAEKARIRAEEVEKTRIHAEEHAKVKTEHRAGEEQIKAEVADRILIGQMTNRLGFVDKQMKAEAAIREGRLYEPEPSGSLSFFSDSDQQGSSLAPPPDEAQGASGRGAAATVIVLSNEE